MRWRHFRASCHQTTRPRPTSLSSLTSLALSWNLAKASLLLCVTVGGQDVESWWTLMEWRLHWALHYSGVNARQPKSSGPKQHNIYVVVVVVFFCKKNTFRSSFQFFSVFDIEMKVHFVRNISCNFRQHESLGQFWECIRRQSPVNLQQGKT